MSQNQFEFKSKLKFPPFLSRFYADAKTRAKKNKDLGNIYRRAMPYAIQISPLQGFNSDTFI
jgi:hypothetical protein